MIILDPIVVLIVEDEPEVRALARTILVRCGFRVLSAADADAALAIMAVILPDLLFTDIVLPGAIDGLQLAARAKSLYPEIKVVATTGYPLCGGMLDQIDSDVLRKPYVAHQLIEHIDKVLAA